MRTGVAFSSHLLQPPKMSCSRTKSSTEYRRALQSFAESEAVSGEDSDDGFDIVESSRKGLDLSHYIEGIAISTCFILTSTNSTQLSPRPRPSRKMRVISTTPIRPQPRSVMTKNHSRQFRSRTNSRLPTRRLTTMNMPRSQNGLKRIRGPLSRTGRTAKLSKGNVPLLRLSASVSKGSPKPQQQQVSLAASQC